MSTKAGIIGELFDLPGFETGLGRAAGDPQDPEPFSILTPGTIDDACLEPGA